MTAMAYDPATVTADELDPRTPASAPHRIVARYPRAVVIQVDQSVGRTFEVYALADIDTGPYDKPKVFRGLTEQWALEMACDWTRLANT